MLFLMLLLFLIPSPVKSGAHITLCPNATSNYTLNSPFHRNLMTLLESLSSFTSLRGGFYAYSIGNGSDRVDGKALCRVDVPLALCKNCVQQASQEIMQECHRKDAIVWHEICQVQYSYRVLFTSENYAGNSPGSDGKDRNVSDRNLFHSSLKFLMERISDKAAFGPSELLFASGEISFSETETLYGLVQCARDITRADCRSCLGSAMANLSTCCLAHQGWLVFSRDCSMRFERYRFYNDSCGNAGEIYLKSKNRVKIWAVIAAACVSAFLVAALIGCLIHRRQHQRKRTKIDEGRSQNASARGTFAVVPECNVGNSQELPFMDLTAITVATDNFSDSNKLGKGGFGTVYKGVLLPDGKEIAVKRLSKTSRQGLMEFKNEIVLIAALQHINLVKLVGCSIEGEEKLLVYEYMPNKSLDTFVFDSEKRSQLNWALRFSIIDGIARGLLYLHEDSRLKIIHRDLKPSNVLLDNEMVAKISDFGMARIFCENQNVANTRRVAGTYGYMAPEYAMEGLFSVKSDVFSFGVILLEIISGKRNSGFYHSEHHFPTLLSYAWKLWKDGKLLEFTDPLVMKESWSVTEVMKCIHIGLLCVQENPADRPTMSSVVILLGSESAALPEPCQPAFSVGRAVGKTDHQSPPTLDFSVNEITCSSICPR